MESVIVNFKSFVFLHRPQKMYAAKMNTYLKVAENEKYVHFVTMANGQIELIRTPKHSQLVQDLVPYNKYSLKHAAQIYMGTTLEKTSKARRALMNILKSTDMTKTDFLPVMEREKLNKPTRQERLTEKANEVTLEQICKATGRDSKVVRALFREHDIKKPGNRWTWPKGQRDKIEKLIKSLESR